MDRQLEREPGGLGSSPCCCDQRALLSRSSVSSAAVGMPLRAGPGLYPEGTGPLGTRPAASPLRRAQETTLGPRDCQDHPQPECQPRLGVCPAPARYLTVPPRGPRDGASRAGDQVGQREHCGPAPAPPTAPGSSGAQHRPARAQAGARCAGRPPTQASWCWNVPGTMFPGGEGGRGRRGRAGPCVGPCSPSPPRRGYLYQSPGPHPGFPPPLRRSGPWMLQEDASRSGRRARREDTQAGARRGPQALSSPGPREDGPAMKGGKVTFAKTCDRCAGQEGGHRCPRIG